MDYIAFIKKKVSLFWVIAALIAPIIAWGLALVFGQGIWWESARLNLDTIRTSLEIREKMNRTLEEISKVDRRNTSLLKAKIEYFNAAEKNLARLEGRSPVLYKVLPAPFNLPLEVIRPTKPEEPKKIENNNEPVVP